MCLLPWPLSVDWYSLMNKKDTPLRRSSKEHMWFLTPNRLRAECFIGNIIYTFQNILPHCYGTGSCNSFSCEKRTSLFYMISVIGVGQQYQQPWCLLRWTGIGWSPHVEGLIKARRSDTTNNGNMTNAVAMSPFSWICVLVEDEISRTYSDTLIVDNTHTVRCLL